MRFTVCLEEEWEFARIRTVVSASEYVLTVLLLIFNSAAIFETRGRTDCIGFSTNT